MGALALRFCAIRTATIVDANSAASCRVPAWEIAGRSFARFDAVAAGRPWSRGGGAYWRRLWHRNVSAPALRPTIPALSVVQTSYARVRLRLARNIAHGPISLRNACTAVALQRVFRPQARKRSRGLSDMLGSYQQYESGQTRTKTDSHVGDDSRGCLGQMLCSQQSTPPTLHCGAEFPKKSVARKCRRLKKYLGKHNCTQCGTPSACALRGCIDCSTCTLLLSSPCERQQSTEDGDGDHDDNHHHDDDDADGNDNNVAMTTTTTTQRRQRRQRQSDNVTGCH